MIFAANHASHIDTPLLLTTLPVALPPPHGRGRGVGLLLRPNLEVRAVVVRPGRRPDRAHQGQPPVGRHRAPSCSRTAGTSSSSPRAGGHPTAGPSPSTGRRRLSGPAHRAARRPGVPARDAPRAAQDRRARGRAAARRLGHRGAAGRPAAALPHRRPVRGAREPGRGRERPPVLRSGRGGRGHAGPRGAVRLVAGPALGQPEPGAPRPGRGTGPSGPRRPPAVATGLGLDEPPVSARRRAAVGHGVAGASTTPGGRRPLDPVGEARARHGRRPRPADRGPGAPGAGLLGPRRRAGPAPRRRGPRTAAGRPGPGCGPGGARAGRCPRTRPAHRALGAATAPLPTPRDLAERHGALAVDRGAPAVVLEPGQVGSGHGGTAAGSSDLGHAPRRRPGARRPCSSRLEQAQTVVGRPSAPGEGGPDDLEPGAHGQHHRTRRPRRAKRAVVDQRPGRPDLRAVLAAAQAVEVGLGQRGVGGGLEQRSPEPRHSARRARITPLPPSP